MPSRACSTAFDTEIVATGVKCRHGDVLLAQRQQKTAGTSIPQKPFVLVQCANHSCLNAGGHVPAMLRSESVSQAWSARSSASHSTMRAAAIAQPAQQNSSTFLSSQLKLHHYDGS